LRKTPEFIIPVTQTEFRVRFKKDNPYDERDAAAYCTPVRLGEDRNIIMPIRYQLRSENDREQKSIHLKSIIDKPTFTHECLHKITDITRIQREVGNKTVDVRGFVPRVFDTETGKHEISLEDNTLQNLKSDIGTTLDEGAVTFFSYYIVANRDLERTRQIIEGITAFDTSQSYKDAALEILKISEVIGVQKLAEAYITNDSGLLWFELQQSTSLEEYQRSIQTFRNIDIHK